MKTYAFCRTKGFAFLPTAPSSSGRAVEKARAQERDGFEAQFRRFADKHCVSWHGPDVQRRRLRLDTLPAAFGDKDAAATWIKVFDRPTRGEMPPPDEPRPPAKET